MFYLNVNQSRINVSYNTICKNYYHYGFSFYLSLSPIMFYLPKSVLFICCFRKKNVDVIKWKAKHTTVETIQKYHTVETIKKYHTVETIKKYHTVETIKKYHTVRTITTSNITIPHCQNNSNVKHHNTTPAEQF